MIANDVPYVQGALVRDGYARGIDPQSGAEGLFNSIHFDSLVSYVYFLVYRDFLESQDVDASKRLRRFQKLCGTYVNTEASSTTSTREFFGSQPPAGKAVTL